MTKICIIGHFGFGQNLLNGQTIKTKIITAEIEKKYGKENVLSLDLAGGVKRIPCLLCTIPRMLSKCDNVVIMPVENGLRFLTPVLGFWNRFFKKKLHYVVIGGWLPQFLTKKKNLVKGLKRFCGIYVETNTMKSALVKLGLNNLFVMPNCKKLTVLSENELVYPQGVPYKLCTFSRVMREKGIETAINVIKKVNDQLGYLAYSLDIYGQVDTTQTEWFENLKKHFSEGVRYCGCVGADKSVEILQPYFALLFPTHFYTEGIPGTIIDAYAAGIPVISAKWESYSDVVDEGMTGIGYEFDNENEFENVLLSITHNPQMLLDMKANCAKKAKDYMPETVIQIITEKFGGGYNLYPLKLCTFSRVMREKGIEDAVKTVIEVNQSLGRTVFSLDIYGQVDENQTDWFEELRKIFPDYIRYGGLIPFDRSVETLKEYFVLLFPTYYEGEGFAGTLIDAYSAGVPVIASDWKYNTELVNENVGYVYKTRDNAALAELLSAVAADPTMILKKKKSCLYEAEKYKIEKAIGVLLDRMEGN